MFTYLSAPHPPVPTPYPLPSPSGYKSDFWPSILNREQWGYHKSDPVGTIITYFAYCGKTTEAKQSQKQSRHRALSAK